jgi:hypothetical protein
LRMHLSIAPYNLECHAQRSGYNFLRTYETLY